MTSAAKDTSSIVSLIHPSGSSKVGAVITGGAALLESLLLEQVDTIFGYPGGAIMPVYDALYDYREQLHHILVRHEQGASHAAEAYARVTGKTGVCLVTSGPGATNLVTGLADAMMDSVPLVCITGQVAKSLLGTDAFQETDIISVTIPVTKWSYQITSAHEIPFVVAKAFAIAQCGRPGPVLIDLTKNAQVDSAEYIPVPYVVPAHVHGQKKEVPQELFIKAASLINTAQKPLILAGNGVQISRAEDELLALAEKAGIPVACTLHGLSVFPPGHPLYAGMLGMHGNYGPNLLTNEADLIIAIGMRFDDRVTGNLQRYATKAKIIHLEIDAAEIGKNVRTEVGLHGSAKQLLEKLLPLVKEQKHDAWYEEFSACKEKEEKIVIQPCTHPTDGAIKMSEAVRLLCEKTKGDAIVCADVGQHQMMAARYYAFNKPRSYISSGGLGTMGFGLPAGIGAKVGAPDRTVVVIAGDGGIQMTIQELGTIMQEKLPVKVVILNNNFLGKVRQWQELFFATRYSFVDMQNPDFVMVAKAYGIAGSSVSTREALGSAFDEMLSTDGPYVLDVVCEKEQNVFPMVPAGAGVGDVRLE